MIEVLVEVGNDTAHFGVAVQAEGIRQAVDIVKSYYSGASVRVVHPIEPETFFVRDPTAPAGLIELQMPESAAG